MRPLIGRLSGALCVILLACVSTLAQSNNFGRAGGVTSRRLTPQSVIAITDSDFSSISSTSDCVAGQGDDVWQLTLTQPKDLTVTVIDCCCPGDFYEVRVDDKLIGTTPNLGPPWGCDFSGPLSSGSFTVTLCTGTHTITIRDAGFDGHSASEIAAENMCPAGFTVLGTLSNPTKGCEFTINVTTFIQTNSLQGPPQARCDGGKQLFFKGDDRGFSATASTFRTRSLITVIPEQSADADGLKEGSEQELVGQTRSYAPDALADGVIDSADDDSVLHDCHLLHDVATASNSNMHAAVTRTGAHVVSVHMFGGAANPLVFGSPEINWDFTITIDTSGSSAHWTIMGAHDGFPSYEVYINNNQIYTFSPGPGPYGFLDILKLFPPLDVNVNRSGDLP